ncbi:GspH/FimT family pseudopilin [Thermodesulfobacteriota bacterium]
MLLFKPFVTSHRQNGMTLIQLMIALAIAGIVTAMATPSIRNWMPRYQLRVGIRAFASELSLTKMRSVTTNQPYGVIFEEMDFFIGQATGYTVFQDVGDTPGQLDDNDVIEREDIKLPKGVYCWINVFDNQTITFDPMGVSNGGWLVIRNSQGKYMFIDVYGTTGRIKIYR